MTTTKYAVFKIDYYYGDDPNCIMWPHGLDTVEEAEKARLAILVLYPQHDPQNVFVQSYSEIDTDEIPF